MFDIDCFDILVCPRCLGVLVRFKKTILCKKCDIHYPISDTGNWDLRLIGTKDVNVKISLGVSHFKQPPFFDKFTPHPTPEVQYIPSELPIHLTPAMASYIPKAQSTQSLCLDLGCGSGEYRVPIEQAGYKWVGFDYNHPCAPIWADGHAIPFRDNTFDFIMSLAVLEHIQYPPVMLREVQRVLKPEGVFLGSVTYLVPFHDSASYYNMTHYGTWSALEDAGLRTEFISAEPNYLGIRAIAYMGLFPGLKRNITYALVEPIVWFYKLYWAFQRKLGNLKFNKEWQAMLNTGAYIFRAVKPTDVG